MLRLMLTLPILLSACLKDETLSGYVDTTAIYRLTEFDGASFDARATIRFAEAGRVQGEGPCNRYSASQTVPYPWIKIEGIVSTKRACPALSLEAAFFEALTQMTLAEASGPVLILSDEDSAEMVFRAD